ncbi:MAG: iron ABC transporter permease [Rhodospirillales bacterium]|nr:iron ABC transporter permease [Rhodospirillales bacterium]
MSTTGRWLVGGIGTVLVLVLSAASIAYGATVLTIDQVGTALLQAVFGAPDGDAVATPVHWIVVDLRLPRTLLAIMVGAGLAMVGVLLQSATRNDLADPFLFGLSSGAAAGAVLVITTLGNQLGVWTLPIAAFCGGLISAVTVLILVSRNGGQGPEKLVLAGLAVSFLFAAATNSMVFAGDQRAAHTILFWSLGGLGLASWENLPFALGGLVVLALFVMLRHRQLDALLAGEETAFSLGVDAERMRREIFLVAAFATASFVALAGVIGFVGLMVPHMARAVVGVRHGILMAASALVGACLLLGSDLASRLLLTPQELPVGIITASCGAFFVIALLFRKPG